MANPRVQDLADPAKPVLREIDQNSVTGDLTVSGDLTVGDDLAVSDEASIGGDLTIQAGGSITVTNGDLNFTAGGIASSDYVTTTGLVSCDDLTATGVVSVAQLGIGAGTPSGTGAAIPDAAGGATIDAEARAAINALLAQLRTKGFITP